MRRHAWPGTRWSASAPPPTTLRAPAEYEPVEAILVAWEGPISWKNILAQMGAAITTLGDADLNRVSFLVIPTDTIWIRDYGPRTVYLNGVRIAVDHDYNRSFTTRLVVRENPNYSEAQIHDIFQAWYGTDTAFYNPLPASVDSTQHIDMWLQIAADLAARGFQVFRTPARKVGSFFSVHYT